MDCEKLNIEIENLVNLIAVNELLAIKNSSLRPAIEQDKKKLANLKLDFDTYGCIVILEKNRQKEVADTKEKYAELDEARINKTSIYERNKRLFFVGMVLLASLGIMISIKKK
jgi:hypothetical protein